jgi:hypothetical protein
MSQQHFFYFLAMPQVEDLLKAEIEHRYGDQLTLSFSRAGFYTYKYHGKRDFLAEEKTPFFAQRMGRFLEKDIDTDQAKKLAENYAFILQSKRSGLDVGEVETLLPWPLYTQAPGLGLDLIRVEKKSYWAGECKLDENSLRLAELWQHEAILPESAPSRAYFKSLYGLTFLNQKKLPKAVIECGSSPGGVTYQLLESGQYVWGIDQAEMKIENKDFKHIQKPIQRCEYSDFSGLKRFSDVMIFNDMNLPPKGSIKEMERLQGIFLRKQHKILCVMVNLKIPDVSMVPFMEDYVKQLSYFSLKNQKILHTPIHRREFMVLLWDDLC